MTFLDRIISQTHLSRIGLRLPRGYCWSGSWQFCSGWPSQDRPPAPCSAGVQGRPEAPAKAHADQLARARSWSPFFAAAPVRFKLPSVRRLGARARARTASPGLGEGGARPTGARSSPRLSMAPSSPASSGRQGGAPLASGAAGDRGGGDACRGAPAGRGPCIQPESLRRRVGQLRGATRQCRIGRDWRGRVGRNVHHRDTWTRRA